MVYNYSSFSAECADVLKPPNISLGRKPNRNRGTAVASGEQQVNFENMREVCKQIATSTADP